jgi:hypothetical protein
MFHFSPRVSIMLTLVVAGSLAAAAGTAQAQSQATPVSLSTTSTTSNPSSATNATWHDGTPTRLISAQIRDGILTIDGMVAKVELNYEIQHAGYLYFFVPGVGTAVVSLDPIQDGVRIKNAFDGSKLAFAVDGHDFELTSKGNLLSKDRSRSTVYVRMDHSTVAVGRYPRMGFGNSTDTPYSWPLSGVSEKDKEAHFVAPPPVPANLLPRTVATETTAPLATSQVNRK